MANIDQTTTQVITTENSRNLLEMPRAAIATIRDAIEQPGFRRAFPTLLATLTGIAAVGLFILMQTPNMTTLYASASDSDKSKMFEALKNMGIFDRVTLATASDFGRTLADNGDGTDHGWGGHQFVVGGAVNGGALYGDIPPPSFGHSQDAGRGRLIPTIAVDQYAASLGRWLGLNDDSLAQALPNLRNFSANPLANLLF